MTATILRDVTLAEYFSDPCDEPSFSQSCATTMVTRSPYHAWLEHPRLGGVGREPSDTFDRGSLLHTLVLDSGKGIEVIQADNYRTNDAKHARDAARRAGRIPVLRDDYADAVEVAESILEGLRELGITLDGESETAVTWEQESSHGPVRCRGMFDHVWWNRGVILDLKRTTNASPAHISRSVWDYGYDIQRAAYDSAMSKLRPEHAGKIEFVFAFFEELPPGAKRRALVTPARLDGMYRELGARRWERAVEMWAECRKTGVWPAYATANQPVSIEPPRWALIQEEMA